MEPVRCFTCNAVLRFYEYEQRAACAPPVVALVGMDVRRFCCRRMYLSHPVALEEHLRTFPLKNDTRRDYKVTFESDTECTVPTD